MLLAFSIAPTGSISGPRADERLGEQSGEGSGDGSVASAVAAAVQVVKDSGLPWELTSMFTTIEGEWDEVMAVIKQAVDAVAAVAPRVSLVMKADIRPGFTGQLTAKVDRVTALLE